jgi:polyhydroxybutyrate depolymerase
MKLPFLLALCLTAIPSLRAADSLPHREWTINGVKREALIYVPANAKEKPTPVVFAFHGHGGSMNNAMRQFGYHTLWPEAIIVYPQGLNTPGQLTDPEGKKPGWQHAPGQLEDRDLKFFDAILASLQEDYKVDAKRVYSTGHSNGAGFTYLLWATRGEKLAAVAPSAAVAAKLMPMLKPKPVLHVAGQNDPLVKFEWQKQTMEELRKINQCEPEGKPWDKGEKGCTIYASKVNAPVITYIHPGTHQFLKEAPAVITKFFKEQSLP